MLAWRVRRLGIRGFVLLFQSIFLIDGRRFSYFFGSLERILLYLGFGLRHLGRILHLCILMGLLGLRFWSVVLDLFLFSLARCLLILDLFGSWSGGWLSSLGLNLCRDSHGEGLLSLLLLADLRLRCDRLVGFERGRGCGLVKATSPRHH